MANAELTINDQIAAVLREINTDWRVYDHVSSENTDALVKKKALRPDILILEPGIPAICIETEYEPAKSVELDATNRLGEVAVKTGGGIQVVIARAYRLAGLIGQAQAREPPPCEPLRPFHRLS